jgi:hypothetical protein
MDDAPGGAAVSDPIDLRLGRWQDVLADVRECDAVITDVPYSEHTISGQRSGTVGYNGGPRATIRYAGLTEAQTREVGAWSCSLARRWVVIFCDHLQWFWLNDEAKKARWMTFQPIPWVKADGGTPRFTADGPSSSSEWIMIARPRGAGFITRYRPGHYSHNTVPGGIATVGITGTKPINLMRALVRDYSEHGDLVVDPFAGSGTTAIACAAEGRRCITSEEKPEHYEIARARILRGVQPSML